jgi:predicted porin
MKFLKQRYLIGVAVIALALPAATESVKADPALDAVLQRLDKLEKENAKLKSEINRVEAKTGKVTSAKTTVADGSKTGANTGFVEVAIKKGEYGAPSGGSKDGPASEDEDWYFRKKADSKGLTFMTPGGQITAYGQLDVSLDATTKGISDKKDFVNAPSGQPFDRPIGNMGWQPALSTNISYVGVRGEQKIGDQPFKFVYQLETQIDITATSGIGESNSNQSNAVKGALTSRNSYIGIASSEWGAIKGGKTDAPYKNSTASMNPFSGMLGDYAVIMGNTGGDNRVEFGTRLDHSIWYESPKWNGFSFVALFSPGQNRASNSDNLAAGESDCAGGNNPVSGGGNSCSDGAFSDALSVSATYETKIENVGVLVTGAYERHQKVNRSSDIGDPALAGLDVADEDAAKVGVQLKLPTKTTISGIYETMHRYVPGVLSSQNERQRDGTWLALTQDITPRDNISFGWAHAFATPGDPGQHNTPGGANQPNSADMLTAAYKHTLAPGWLWYVDAAATLNDSAAHYDLGAGGRGVTTDCHDAFGSAGGSTSTPHCWAGGTLVGVSTGLRYNF